MTTETSNQTEKNFSIINIYTKDVSFESPNSPHIFSIEWKPKVDFDVQIGSSVLDENIYEATLNVTVTTKVILENKETKETEKNKNEKNNPEEKTAFLAEIQQAGIFAIEGFTEKEVEQILAINAEEILFPYAREVISNLVSKGGFPQMLIPPVNFEALYLEHQKDKESQTDPNISTEKH